MNAFSKALALCAVMSQIGCATSIKGKVFQNALIAGTAGAVYGNSLETYKTTHAAMYGGLAAAVTAIATVYYLDPDQEVEKARKTTTKLRDELDDFENGYSGTSKRSHSSFNGPAISSFDKLPEEYRRMINPGQWSISEIDQWIDGGEGRIIHQDKMLELKPATLKAR